MEVLSVNFHYVRRNSSALHSGFPLYRRHDEGYDWKSSQETEDIPVDFGQYLHAYD